MAPRFRSASMSAMDSATGTGQQPRLNQIQSDPEMSRCGNVSRRFGTVAFRRIYPPETRLVLSQLTDYEKQVYALILRHDPAIYRTPREFFSRTASMIPYLPPSLRNPLPFGLHQDKVVNLAHKLGASRETLLRTSYLCTLHLQLNGLVTVSARNMVETHTEDFLYDIQKLIRKRNLFKLSHETKAYIMAAEDTLAMTLPPREWTHFYKRAYPANFDSRETACDACFMTKISGSPDALIGLRGIALTCIDSSLLDDLGNERSQVAVEWVDAVLMTYNDAVAQLMKKESRSMADDIHRVLRGDTLPATTSSPNQQAVFERQKIRQSLQASNDKQESIRLSTQTIDYLSVAIDETSSRFSGSLAPTLRDSILSNGSNNQALTYTNVIKGSVSVPPVTAELLALVPAPLNIKKQPKESKPQSDESTPSGALAGASDNIFAGRSAPRAAQVKVQRSSSVQAIRRGTVSALPLSAAQDALDTYQSRAPGRVKSSNSSSLGASTIMSEIERAPVFDTPRNTANKPPSAPPRRMASTASTIAPPSTSSSYQSFDSQGHRRPLPPPISSPSNRRGRHIAQAEALLTESTSPTAPREVHLMPGTRDLRPAAQQPVLPGSRNVRPPVQQPVLQASAYVPNAAALRAQGKPTRRTFAEHAADRPSMLWQQPPQAPPQAQPEAQPQSSLQSKSSVRQEQIKPRPPPTSSIYSTPPTRPAAPTQLRSRPPPTSSVYSSPPARPATPEQSEIRETRRLDSMVRGLRASSLMSDTSYAPGLTDAVAHFPSQDWNRMAAAPSAPPRSAARPPRDDELAARRCHTPNLISRAPSTVSDTSRASNVPSSTAGSSSDSSSNYSRPSSTVSSTTNHDHTNSAQSKSHNKTRADSSSTDASKTSLGPWDMMHEAGCLPYRNSYAPDNQAIYDLIDQTRDRLSRQAPVRTRARDNVHGKVRREEKQEQGPWDQMYAAGGLPFRHSYVSVKGVWKDDRPSIGREEGGAADEEAVVGG